MIIWYGFEWRDYQIDIHIDVVIELAEDNQMANGKWNTIYAIKLYSIICSTCYFHLLTPTHTFLSCIDWFFYSRQNVGWCLSSVNTVFFVFIVVYRESRNFQTTLNNFLRKKITFIFIQANQTFPRPPYFFLIRNESYGRPAVWSKPTYLPLIQSKKEKKKDRSVTKVTETKVGPMLWWCFK